MFLRGKCIAYGSYKKSLKIKTEQKLIEEIQILEDMLHIDNTLLDKWETKGTWGIKNRKFKGKPDQKLNGSWKERSHHIIFIRPSRDGPYYVIGYGGRTGGRPHRFPHNNFSSVYQIFTKHDFPVEGEEPYLFWGH